MERSRYGGGSIQHVYDKDGRLVPNKWIVMLYVTDPFTGCKKRVKRRVSGGKKAAQAAAREMAADPMQFFDDPTTAAPETFEAYATEWLERRQIEVIAKTLKESTFKSYSSHVATLCEHLNETPLASINARTVNKVLADIRREKSAALGRQVTESTMRRVFAVMTQIMKAAYMEDIIDSNPCDKAMKPKPSKVERKALTVEEARRLLDIVRAQESEAMADFYEKEARLKKCGHANKPRENAYGSLAVSRLAAVILALATGMRQGEILALRWQDVDLASGAINVRHSLTRHGELTDTKTHQVRCVPISADAVEALKRLKRFRSDVMSAVSGADATMVPATQHVICSNVFEPIDKSNFGMWWSEWREANGFNGLKFHELRHTHASILVNAGVPITVVQLILGHASAVTTAAFYLHADERQAKEAADTLGAILNASNEPPANVESFSAA